MSLPVQLYIVHDLVFWLTSFRVKRIGIAIGTVKKLTISPGNSLQRSVGSGNVEIPGSAHRDPSGVRSNPFAARHNGAHHIPCPETVNTACSFRPGARKTVSVHAAHLAGTVPCGADGKRGEGRRDLYVCARLAHAGRIHPMCFGQAEGDTIEFCSSACTAFNGQTYLTQTPIEHPAGCINSGSIPQRLTGLRVQVGIAKLGGGLVPFFLVARPAGKG